MPFDTFFNRLLFGTLWISLPMVIVLGIVVFTIGTQTITDATKAETEVTATSASTRVSDWIAERQISLDQVAMDQRGNVGRAALNPNVLQLTDAGSTFDGVGVVTPDGIVTAFVGSNDDLNYLGTAPWFSKSLSVDTIQPITLRSTGLEWLITAPIVGPDGKPQGVVIGDLNVTALGVLLQPYGQANAANGNREVHIANREHLLVYSSDWYRLSADSAILARGAFKTKAEGAIVDKAFTSDKGSDRIVDYRNRDVLAGYQSIPSLGFVVIASVSTAAALAPVYSLERLIVIIAIVGTLFIVGFAFFLTRLTVRPILALSRVATRVEAGDLSVRGISSGVREMRLLGAAFNAMVERLGGVLFRLRGEVTESASKLSAAAEELASATFEQTTAATETSAAMEEVARSSTSIATTVDRVAVQAGEVRSELALAQADLKVSAARTLALASSVNEIEAVLDLINDIADQTNLLALNAAIEAARAGDAGRGFAVVADEVRRLAERSKAGAAQIAKLVEGAQTQGTESVLALERRGNQMDRWLAMMKVMAEASEEVRRATQEQSASTAQVVRAIEHIAEGSRSISITAQQIAAAAANQTALAADVAGRGRET